MWRKEIELDSLTIGDFFGVKFETGIKSRWVGRFNVGSGVTGIGSIEECAENKSEPEKK